MLKDVVNRWTTVDTSELYDVARWGNGYFSVHANGHLLVHPERDPARAIDLKELAERLEMRGLSLPILVRFSGILKDRITRDPSRLRQRHQRVRLQGRLLVRLSRSR